ncbi:cytochrome C nitrite reductase [Sphingomonas qilianensis]|uniref:Cytochrome C nitrite reductase n=1 Tax=Sphingomonas qilianensis TaxID=1736690 RepID=A0ABU9XVU4_9SPHN
MSRRTIAVAVLALMAVLAIGWMLIPRPDASAPRGDDDTSVSGGGITLTSATIALPEESAALPAGSALITANCTACHSVEMLTAQPPLNAEKWQATIDKMRGVYKAPIAPGDDQALIGALLALPAQRPASTAK